VAKDGTVVVSLTESGMDEGGRSYLEQGDIDDEMLRVIPKLGQMKELVTCVKVASGKTTQVNL